MVIVGILGILGLWEGVKGGGVWCNIVRSGEEIDGFGIEFTSSCVGVLGDRF